MHKTDDPQEEAFVHGVSEMLCFLSVWLILQLGVSSLKRDLHLGEVST